MLSQSNFRYQLSSDAMAASRSLLRLDSNSSLSTIYSEAPASEQGSHHSSSGNSGTDSFRANDRSDSGVADLEQLELKELTRGTNLDHSPVHTTRPRMDDSQARASPTAHTEFPLSDEVFGALGGYGGARPRTRLPRDPDMPLHVQFEDPPPDYSAQPDYSNQGAIEYGGEKKPKSLGVNYANPRAEFPILPTEGRLNLNNYTGWYIVCM